MPFLFSKLWIKMDEHGENKRPILIPSGKLLHNYGKSPFLMGKLTINGHFQ